MPVFLLHSSSSPHLSLYSLHSFIIVKSAGSLLFSHSTVPLDPQNPCTTHFCMPFKFLIQRLFLRESFLPLLVQQLPGYHPVLLPRVSFHLSTYMKLYFFFHIYLFLCQSMSSLRTGTVGLCPLPAVPSVPVRLPA